MKRLLKTFFGFLLLLPVFARETFGIGLDDFRDEVFRPDNLPAPAPGDVPAESRINELTHFITDTILYASGALAVLMLIIGGILYISYMGNEERLESAKRIIKHTLTGLFVVILAYAIVTNVIDLIFRAAG